MAVATEMAVKPAEPEPTTFDRESGNLVIPTQIPGVVLTFRPDQETLEDKQMTLLAPLGIEASWDPRQVAVFLMQCQQRQLDPWGKEAYLMRYRDVTAPTGYRYVTHIGINGYRTRAESTGQYAGQTEPVYCGPDGQWTEIWPHRDRVPYAAKVGVLRTGFPQPVYGVALFEEYAGYKDVWEGPQGERRKVGRELVQAWKPAAHGGKPCIMTAKVAEALAFRKAFPRNLHGLYLEEEFYHLRNPAPGPVQAPDEHEAATRRRAAHAAAQADAHAEERESIIIGNGEPPPDPQPAEVDAEQARPLLLDELAEQAEILGHSVDHLTARWSARRGGAVFRTATVAEMAAHIRAIRPLVVTALREAGRGEEADTYEHAPAYGTCEQLFGRDRHVRPEDTPEGGEAR